MKYNIIVVKIVMLIIFIIFLSSPTQASNIDILNKIENNIYGFDYTNDSIQNRVTRLEKCVYGKSSNGDINKRIKKLSDDISADVIGLEIPAARDSFSEDEYLAEDSSVDYPIVNEIEKKLFNTTYKNRDFHTRIVTIEKKLFGKIYDVDDYSKRMERIKSKIMPETLAKASRFDSNGDEYFNKNYIDTSEITDSGFNSLPMPFGQRKLTKSYSNYGNNMFNNTQIPSNDANLLDDLTQMEYDTFGTEFSNEDTNTRIKRLNSVNKAKKSSRKYDSQKFSQHMSTAMEIGAMILMILAMVL